MKSATNLAFLLAVLASGSNVGASQWGPKSSFQRGGRSALNSVSLLKAEGAKETSVLSPRGGGSDEEGKATITASVFNLVNNVAGAGILTLSAAMASGSGWIPAVSICAILGALSGHSFSIIGEACELTGEADFKVSFRHFLQ
jgi:hypothetical protein